MTRRVRGSAATMDWRDVHCGVPWVGDETVDESIAMIALVLTMLPVGTRVDCGGMAWVRNRSRSRRYTFRLCGEPQYESAELVANQIDTLHRDTVRRGPSGPLRLRLREEWME